MTTRREALAMAAGLLQPRVPERQPAAGSFLVAARELPDPNFSRTVVLLTQYGGKGAGGVVINRPGYLKISEVLGDWPAAKQRQDMTYVGWPVHRTGVLALVRSGVKIDQGLPVLADVYQVTTRPSLEKVLPHHDAAHLRVFLGYSGWGAGQLEMELRIGSWHVVRGEAGAVFDPNPGSLWDRWIRRTEQRIA